MNTLLKLIFPSVWRVGVKLCSKDCSANSKIERYVTEYEVNRLHPSIEFLTRKHLAKVLVHTRPLPGEEIFFNQKLILALRTTVSNLRNLVQNNPRGKMKKRKGWVHQSTDFETSDFRQIKILVVFKTLPLYGPRQEQRQKTCTWVDSLASK